MPPAATPQQGTPAAVNRTPLTGSSRRYRRNVARDARIIAYEKAGMARERMAREFGVSKARICQIIAENGLFGPTARPHRREARLVAMYLAGAGFQAINEETAASRSVIVRALLRAGVQIRRVGPQGGRPLMNGEG